MNTKIFVAFVLLFVFSVQAHPVKMSTAHLNFMDGDGSVVFTFFQDDFKSHLSEKYLTEVDLESKEHHQNVLSHYINENFTLEINGKVQNMKLVAVEFLDDNRVDVDFEFHYHGHIKTVSVHNALLFDAYDEQSNLVYVNPFDGRNKQILRFTSEEPVKILEY